MKRFVWDSSGQTVIALLIFVMLVVTLSTAAATITIVNIQSNNGALAGQQALANAESGVENALLRLQRDPSYAGETLTLGSGTATISVSGTTTKTIVSVGSSGDYRRSVTADAGLTGGVLTLTNWSETP